MKFFLIILTVFFLSSCIKGREVRLHTWSEYTIENYKIVHGQFTHGFPRRYDAYRLYKIKKNGREKMLLTTNFQYLDTTKCTLFFEINNRRKINFDVCKKKRIKKSLN
jgi:hypothetical protein